MSHPTPAQFSTALAWAWIALLSYLLYLIVQPFLIPLGWACVIAVLLYPAYTRLSRRIGPGRAAGVMTVTVALVLIVPVIVLTSAFAREMIDIAQSLRDTFVGGQTSPFEAAWGQVVARVPAAARLDISTAMSAALQRAATFLMSESGTLVTNIAVFFLDLALALFATFFLLRDGDLIMRAVRRLLPMPPASRDVFIQRTSDLIAAGVTSSVIVASLQGLFGGLSFQVLGLSAPVFWGVLMAFACLLPFGAGVIWLPAAIYLAATGATTKGLILVGLGVGIVGMVDNVVRPLLMSERVHMNGLVIFVSLLGGLNVFGLLGILLGPIVVVTAIALVTTYVEAAPDSSEMTSGS